jgi:hypothetical protein
MEKKLDRESEERDRDSLTFKVQRSMFKGAAPQHQGPHHWEVILSCNVSTFREFPKGRNEQLRESLMVFERRFCRLPSRQRFGVACLLLTQYSLLLPIR